VQISDAAQPQSAAEPVVEPEAMVDEEAAMPPHNLPAEEAYGFCRRSGQPRGSANQEHAALGGAAGGWRKGAPRPHMESTSIRVDVKKVDQLINLVGELVITQAMLAQNSQGWIRRPISSCWPVWPIWIATRATCKSP
jgi:two-component system chemotaxis sensor kinase CheA